MSNLPAEEVAVKGIARDIARELREHPSHWFQGALTRFADGTESPYLEKVKQGVCWCLEGHISRRVDSEVATQAIVAFLDEAHARYLIEDGASLFKWNDAPGRTVEQVIELCEAIANG